MEACSIFCTLCLVEIAIPPGRGVAFSCQCFFCEECFPPTSQVPINCPSCKSLEPDIVSLNKQTIPEEIKSLLGNPNKIFENLSDIISFQTSHYKSVIKSAHDQILKLKAIIKDLQSRNLSTKRSMDDGGQETAFRFKKSKDKFSYFKTLIRN